MEFNARLDADHLAVLDVLPPDLLDLSDINATREGLAVLREAMSPPEIPDSISLQDHYTDSADGHRVMIRTYTPASNRANTPALYWIHGGGMVLGQVDMNDEWCADIASTLDVVVASVEYRLAPEFPYPVPMDDCYSGLTWLFEYAAGAGIDTSRIAVGGGSAGGGLAAGLALLARDRGEVAPCFQLLTYPMIDDRNITPSSHMISDLRLWNREANLAGWNAYLGAQAGGDDVDIYAAPSRATDLAGLPPAVISVGDLDMFLDEDIDYAQRLLRAGVPTELHIYAGAFHGSNTFVAHSDLSQRWRRDELEALRKALND